MIVLPHRTIVFTNALNREGQTPDNLSQVAREGSGIYAAAHPVWGELLEHLTCRVSPETHSSGQVFFSRSHYNRDRFMALCQLLDIKNDTDYTVYTRNAENPLQEAYLTQWRFINYMTWRLPTLGGRGNVALPLCIV